LTLNCGKSKNHAEVDPKMNPPHTFDPAHIAVLESEDRRIWQNPEDILGAIKLEHNWVAVDFGCGSGYFTVPLARRVKKVYAIDIQKEMLSFVKDKTERLGIRNVELRLSRPNEIPLEDETVDFLLSVNTLHEFDDKLRTIEEMKRVVKHKGNLLIVDFKKQKTDFGPPVRIRVAEKKAISLFESYDFALLDTKDLPYHYILTFTKS
jgi:ubiquinone/menaquinone biosynthesis C-methylase UbiE